MRGAKVLSRIGVGLAVALGIVGCVGLTGMPLPGTAARQQQPRPFAASLPANAAAAQPTDIPVVPLPAVPTGGETAVRPAAAPPALPAGSNPDQPPAQPVRPQAPPPPDPPPAAAGLDAVRQLHRAAADRYGPMDSYIVRMTRRETVNGVDGPEELIMLRYRKQPLSVHLKWLGPVGEGREVLYVKGAYDDKMQILMADGDWPLGGGAGKKMSFPIDSPMVTRKSRHSITDAGVGVSIDRLGAVLAANAHGDFAQGQLNYLGPQPRPEYPRPVACVEHVLPAGSEKDLPRGGRRYYFFDPETQLPMLVLTKDDTGKQVEYYFHDRLQPSVHLDDADFDPAKVWARPPATASGRKD